MAKWNLLPDDAIYRIYQMKHQLEMKESLRNIERFKHREFEQSNVYFNCVSPIKDLSTYRKTTTNIYICLKNYNYVDEEECYFKMSPERMDKLEAEFDISIRPFHDCDMDSYPVAVLIRYKKSRLQNPVT